eukprot:270179_1
MNLDLNDPNVHLYILQEIKYTMHRLNVTSNEIQKWLNGYNIPINSEKLTLFKCVSSYNELLKDNNRRNDNTNQFKSNTNINNSNTVNKQKLRHELPTSNINFRPQ